MKFQVWSPLAKSIELVLEHGALEMARDAHNWWSVEAADVTAGAKYQFRVDGSGPFPDPRSPWQPHGVHGPSVVLDHSSFHWENEGFIAKPLAEAVIYELHVGTFTSEGTYAAAADRLGYLRDLGVTHVELMPLASFPGARGWGYDGVALYAPHPAYGTPDELKAFIQHAHGLGLAVLLDVVYNHLGPDGNYLGVFGPYFTSRFKTPWGDAMNFDDAHSDEVRTFFIENALMWLRDYHFDGLRLDAVHAIIDENATHFLEQLAARVAELSAVSGRPLVLIAESDLNNPRLVHSPARGGYGLDAHWEDDFHHAIHSFFTGERGGYYADFGSLGDVAKTLEQGYVLDGQYSAFRKRTHGRPPLDIAPHQLVVCAQNHDQIGNRALGERLSQLVDASALQAISALVLLGPFTPMLFQGEEWGARTPFLFFTDHHDELGRAVTEGRQREFAAFAWEGVEVPDPQAPETFLRSKLRWEEIDDPACREMLEWHRSLIALRRTIPSGTPVDVRYDEAARWLTLRRGSLLAVFNFAEEPREISLPEAHWHPRLFEEGTPSIFPPRSTTLLTAHEE